MSKQLQPQSSQDKVRVIPRARPAVYLLRAAAAHVRAAAELNKMSPSEVAARMWGRSDEATQAVLRASTTQATTATSGWAAEISQKVTRDFLAAITSFSAGAEVLGRGLQVDLDGYGQITVPGRVLNAAAAGQWVGEAGAAPVRALQIIAGAKLVPRELSTIAVFTREMSESSLIEDVVRQTTSEAAGLALDAAMFSNLADDGAHPQGLLFGVTPITAATGGDVGAMAADIKALFAALAANGAGKNAVIVAAVPQLASLKIYAGAKFDFEVFGSQALAAGTVVALEPSSVVSGISPVPTFFAGNQNALHMEDTSPGNI